MKKMSTKQKKASAKISKISKKAKAIHAKREQENNWSKIRNANIKSYKKAGYKERAVPEGTKAAKKEYDAFRNQYGKTKAKRWANAMKEAAKSCK